MRGPAIVLAVCVTLGIPALPEAARAGGKMLVPAPANFKVHSDARPSFKTHSDFRPKSAFGGPGGFPLPIGEDRRGGHLSRRVPRHAFFPRFASTAFLYSPAVLYTPPSDPVAPVVSVAPVVYVSPTVYVSPPTASVAAVPPAAPSQASIVEYPTGRYELRGDGVSTAHTWVWVPNPPAAPPAAPSPPREDPPAASTPSEGRSQTYRWTDEAGTTFWTNRLEKVPERYRPRTQGSAPVVPWQ